MTNRTRVLIVSQFFPPESMGGAHRWQRLLSELPEEMDCRVVCPPPAFPYGEFDPSYRPIERETVDGVPVTRLWTFQPSDDSRANESNLGRILNYILFSLFATLYVAVNFWRYDCVVTVSAPHTTFLPGFVGQLLGCAWVVDIFDLWLDNAVDLGYAEPGSLAYRYIYALERLAITRSDHVTVITETMAQAYIEKFDVPRDRFSLLPFGVDGELFAPSSKSTDSKRVLYVGNMGDTHALRPFIEAFEHVPSEYSLELVGDGKRREELERLAAERGLANRVHFTGFVDRSEVADRLRDSVLSLVPLKQDFHLDYARPNKLLESMAVGTPFVGSDITEIRQVVAESNAGVVVDNDPVAIGEAITELVDDPERREQMGADAVSYIELQHRWPILGERLRNVLSSVQEEC